MVLFPIGIILCAVEIVLPQSTDALFTKQENQQVSP